MQDDPEKPKALISLEGVCDAELESVNWNLEIDEKTQKICCYLSKGASSVVHALRTFKYRPGTLILDDVRDMTDPLDAKVKTFRSQEFQELMDEFRIDFVHNCTMQHLFRGASYRDCYKGTDAYTVAALSNGGLKVVRDSEGKVKKFVPVHSVRWVLEVIRHDGNE